MSADDRTLPPDRGEGQEAAGGGERRAWRSPEPDRTQKPADTQRVGKEDETRAEGGAGAQEPDSDPTLQEAQTVRASDTRRVEGPLFDLRYRIVRTLGAGGFGRVDLVADTLHEDRQLALKIILPQHQDVKEFEGRFRNEIRVLRALQHPGIPQIFNDGRTEQGEFYFTMDYVDGTSLDEVLKREKSLQPERIVRLVRQLISILDYAHSRGVVHRDLKPANIILLEAGTENEQVRVLDFGIAKILRKEGMLSDVRTMDTMGPMGTPHYMAPEQVRGKDVDPRADLYALGVLIYHMVSRRFPFKGTTAMEIATARLDTEPAPLDVEDTPVQLRTLIKLLLEREREKRPDIAEIQRMLGEIASGQHTLRRVGRQVLIGGALLFLAALLLLQPWKRTASAGNGEVVAPGPGREPGPPIADPNGVDPDGGDPHGGGGSRSTEPEPAPVSPPDEKDPEIEIVQTPGMEIEPDVFYLRTPGSLVGRVVDDVAVDALLSDEGDESLDEDGGFSIRLFSGSGGEDSRIVRLVARDRAGNEAERSLTFHYDPRPPVIQVSWNGQLPADGARLVASGGSATVDVAVDERLEQLLLNGKPSAPGSVPLSLDASAARGEFRFQAFDLAGNESDLSLTLQRETKLSGPLLANGEELPDFEAEPLVTTAASLILSGACDHPAAELWMSIDGGAPIELDPTGDGRFVSPAIDLTKETHRIRLYGPGLDRTVTVHRQLGRVPPGLEQDQGAVVDASGWFRTARNRDGMSFLLVPPPKKPYSFDDVAIDLEQPFYISETEVTVKEYGAAGMPDHPVTNVSFKDAQAFCRSRGGRLPTEEEWLHASCGEDENEYPWGMDWDPALCPLGKSTTAVFEHARSWCDVVGLAGNVSEWCTDGPDGEPRLRGGSYLSTEDECKASQPPEIIPSNANNWIGFRVVVPVEPERDG